MMNASDYIVNPMWFYWLHLVGEIRALCFCICVVFVIFAIIGLLVLFSEWDWMDEEEAEKIKRIAKRAIITFMVILIVGIVTPSRRTLIEMQIAQHATYSNLEKVEEKIQNATDYILDKLQSDE